MSERGSFCTEYVHCSKCFEIIKKYLRSKTKYLCSQVTDSWEEEGNLPIIAGKIGGLYSNEEIETMCSELAPALSKEICHDLRVVVMANSGDTAVFELHPSPDIDLEKDVVDPIQTVRKGLIERSKNLSWLSVQAKELGWVLRPMSQEERAKS